MWSFYFMLLDFLGEPLPWRNCKGSQIDEVKEIKTKCFQNPEKHLWKTATKDVKEVKNIFYSIQNLNYEDEPEYEYIRSQLQSIYDKTLSGKQSTKTSKLTKSNPIKIISPRLKRKSHINLEEMEEENSNTKLIEGKRLITFPSQYIEYGIFPCCSHCIKQACQITTCNAEQNQAENARISPRIIEGYMMPVPAYMPNYSQMAQYQSQVYPQLQSHVYQPQFSPYLQQNNAIRPAPSTEFSTFSPNIGSSHIDQYMFPIPLANQCMLPGYPMPIMAPAQLPKEGLSGKPIEENGKVE